MKKYAALLITTALVIGLLVGIRMWVAPRPVEVRLVTINGQTVRQTVDCSGRVELSESEEVYCDLLCVAGDVYVTAGQRVEAGDPLFAVDVDATQAVLSQLGQAVNGDINDMTSYTVTAPAAGMVTELNVRRGEVTDPSVPCAVIAPGEKLQIAAVIREKYLQQIKVGQRVEISGVGFEKPVYHGTVVSIADVARQQYVGAVNETVVDAVVMFDSGETDQSLRVGLGATATVVVDTVENGLLVPYDCVSQDEEGNEYVYVYGEDGTARRRLLTVGRECTDGILVVSGISAGERLVQDPEQLSGEYVSVCEAG